MRLELLDADGQAVEVETDDGMQPVVFFDDVPFEVGRPAGLKPGRRSTSRSPSTRGRCSSSRAATVAAHDRRRGRRGVAVAVLGAPRARGADRPGSRRAESPPMQRAKEMAASATLYGRSALRVARVRAARRRGAPRLRRRLAPLGNDLHGERARLAARLRRPRRGAAVEGRDPVAGRPSRRRGRACGSDGSSSACAGSGSRAGSAASSRHPRRASSSTAVAPTPRRSPST